MTKHRIGTPVPDDDVEVLSAWRGTVASPSPEALTSVREQVLAAQDSLAVDAPQLKRRMLTPRRLAFAAVVAAVALLVPAAAGQLWPTSSAQAEAATLLESAADRAISSTDATLAPGQWLQVHTVGKFQYAIPKADGSMSAGWQAPQVSTFWVPKDRSGDWYLHRTDYGSKTPNVVAEKGTFYGTAGPYWQEPSTRWLDELTRDPGELRAKLMHDVTNDDKEAFVYIADLLRSGIVPADLRASLFRVLATIDGVSIGDRRVTLDGQTGVAFAHNTDGEFSQQVIIDPETGRFIGERYLDPAGEVTGSASTDYDVVDEVPASVRDTAQRTPWLP